MMNGPTQKSAPPESSLPVNSSTPEISGEVGFISDPGLMFSGRTLRPADILQLQRTIGNQAVMRLLQQRKSRDNAPPSAAGAAKAPPPQPEPARPDQAQPETKPAGIIQRKLSITYSKQMPEDLDAKLVKISYDRLSLSDKNTRSAPLLPKEKRKAKRHVIPFHLMVQAVAAKYEGLKITEVYNRLAAKYPKSIDNRPSLANFDNWLKSKLKLAAKKKEIKRNREFKEVRPYLFPRYYEKMESNLKQDSKKFIEDLPQTGMINYWTGSSKENLKRETDAKKLEAAVARDFQGLVTASGPASTWFQNNTTTATTTPQLPPVGLGTWEQKKNQSLKEAFASRFDPWPGSSYDEIMGQAEDYARLANKVDAYKAGNAKDEAQAEYLFTRTLTQNGVRQEWWADMIDQNPDTAKLLKTKKAESDQANQQAKSDPNFNPKFAATRQEQMNKAKLEKEEARKKSWEDRAKREAKIATEYETKQKKALDEKKANDDYWSKFKSIKKTPQTTNPTLPSITPVTPIITNSTGNKSGSVPVLSPTPKSGQTLTPVTPPVIVNNSDLNSGPAKQFNFTSSQGPNNSTPLFPVQGPNQGNNPGPSQSYQPYSRPQPQSSPFPGNTFQTYNLPPNPGYGLNNGTTYPNITLRLNQYSSSSQPSFSDQDFSAQSFQDDYSMDISDNRGTSGPNRGSWSGSRPNNDWSGSDFGNSGKGSYYSNRGSSRNTYNQDWQPGPRFKQFERDPRDFRDDRNRKDFRDDRNRRDFRDDRDRRDFRDDRDRRDFRGDSGYRGRDRDRERDEDWDDYYTGNKGQQYKDPQNTPRNKRERDQSYQDDERTEKKPIPQNYFDPPDDNGNGKGMSIGRTYAGNTGMRIIQRAIKIEYDRVMPVEGAKIKKIKYDRLSLPDNKRKVALADPNDTYAKRHVIPFSLIVEAVASKYENRSIDEVYKILNPNKSMPISPGVLKKFHDDLTATIEGAAKKKEIKRNENFATRAAQSKKNKSPQAKSAGLTQTGKINYWSGSQNKNLDREVEAKKLVAEVKASFKEILGENKKVDETKVKIDLAVLVNKTEFLRWEKKKNKLLARAFALRFDPYPGHNDLQELEDQAADYTKLQNKVKENRIKNYPTTGQVSKSEARKVCTTLLTTGGKPQDWIVTMVWNEPENDQVYNQVKANSLIV